MRKLISLACLLLLSVAANATGPAKTQITDTLYDHAGNLLNGTVIVTNPSEFTSADGFVIAKGTILTLFVRNGALSVAVVPTTGSTPSGVSYSVTYFVSGTKYTETWVVPSSGSPVNLASIRVLTPPVPTILIGMAQVTPPPNCSGLFPKWTGTQWTCSSSSGSGYSTIENNGTALAQQLTENFFGGITCSNNSLNSRTDCQLTNTATTVAGQSCVLGATCRPASTGLADFSTTAPTTAGKIPIYDPTATNAAGGTGAYVPGDPLVQGTQADGSATEPNPVMGGVWDGVHMHAALGDTSGRQTVNINGTVPVSGTFWQTTQPVSAASLPLPSGAAQDATVSGLEVAQASTTSGQKGVLTQGAVTTSAPTDTTGQTAPISLTTAGAVRVDGSGATQPVSGTVTANAGTGTFATKQVDSGGGDATDTVNHAVKVNIVAGGGTGGGPADAAANAAASESDTARQKTTAALRLLDTSQSAGSQLVTAKGDQTSGMWMNCKAGCSAAGDTTTGSTALGALNATITIALAGETGATFQLQSGGTGVYTVTPQCSLDGGTTYNVNGYLQDPVSGQLSLTATVASAQATTDYPVVCAPHSSHAQMKVTAYTSGTANWLARSTVNNGREIIFGAVQTSAPAPGNNTVAPLSLTTAGAVRVDNSGVTQPVSGTFWQATQPVSGTFWQATQPVSAADGQLATIGTKTDAKSTATDTTSVSVVSVLKEISAMAQAPATTPISAASLPLPTGAAQDSTLTGGSAKAIPEPSTASGDAVSECAIVSAASTNATNCKASAGNFYGYELYNTTTTIYYLRLYNASAAPTCSSATGFIRSIPLIPAAAAGGSGGQVVSLNFPVNYSTGISFCITGGSGSTDNTNAAVGILGAIRYK